MSVDGLELVAGLYVLAQRRAGRATGKLPWVALLVGTAASLAANIAVGGNDFVGRALAGWPAISLLVSLKLLFSMFDHDSAHDRRTVRDDQRTVPDGPAVFGTGPGTVSTGRESSGTITGTGTGAPGLSGSTPGPPAGDAATPRGSAVVRLSEVTPLLAAARAARDSLTETGKKLSRDRLADRMREDGYGVSNARAGLLLRILKAERQVSMIDTVASRASGSGLPEEHPHVAA